MAYLLRRISLITRPVSHGQQDNLPYASKKASIASGLTGICTGRKGRKKSPSLPVLPNSRLARAIFLLRLLRLHARGPISAAARSSAAGAVPRSATAFHVTRCDVTRLLDTEKMNRHFQEMVSLMVSYNMFPKIDSQISLQQFYALHYKHIYQLISHLHKEERHLENDKDLFWPLLGQIFSKLDTTKASKELIVKLINEKIRYKGLL
jgi:hypothetical protein